MIKKLLFEFTFNYGKYDVEYYPDIKMVKNNITNQNICEFVVNEMPEYFYLDLEFDKYSYSDIYKPSFDKYQTQIVESKYNVMLCLNLDNIISAIVSNKTLQRGLSVYLLQTEINSFTKHKRYDLDFNLVSKFISKRNSFKVQVNKWFFVKLNSNYYFNFKKKTIINADEVPKLIFTRKGGIIETNNVKKLLKENFMDDVDDTLVIMPKNLKYLWKKKNVNIMTYSDILKVERNDIPSVNQVIIHELNMNMSCIIRNIIRSSNCKKVWIINSLPLHYYYYDNGKKKISINETAKLLDFWLDLTIKEKGLYKTSLIKFMFAKFKKIYKIIHYPNDTSISTTTLFLSEFENDIYSQFNEKYYHWKKNLTENTDSKYSFTSKSKTNSIEDKIFSSVMSLASSVKKDKLVGKFFKPINKRIISDTISNLMIIQALPFLNYNSFTQMSDRYDESKLQTILTNHNRYLKEETYELEDNGCPVCYSDTNYSKIKLICGHSFCLDCIINAISNAKKCPICNEHADIDKLCIIKESLNNYDSNFINYFKNLSNAVVITNMKCLYYISKKYEIIDLTNINKINNFSFMNITKIIIFTTPNYNRTKEIDMLIGYLILINQKVKITRIIIGN